MAASSVALARHVPGDRREVMRPSMDRVEATMARSGGADRADLRHRVEVVEGDFGPHPG